MIELGNIVVVNIVLKLYTAQKMKFSIKDFFSKCDQICKKLQIWSNLLKKSLMENFPFCAVLSVIRTKGEKTPLHLSPGG